MEGCSVRYALSLLNGKWKLQIVWAITQAKVIRFNELQRQLKGISSLMLSKSLQELERDKIVQRCQYNEIPPRVEYRLTELGETLKSALFALGEWGANAFKTIENSQIPQVKSEKNNMP